MRVRHGRTWIDMGPSFAGHTANVGGGPLLGDPTRDSVPIREHRTCAKGHDMSDAYIKSNGKRSCRPCAIEYQTAYQKRKAA